MDLWLGFLTATVIQKCEKLARERCPGCRDKLKSPLLHQCHQHGLMSKLTRFSDEVKGSLLPSLEKLYESAKDAIQGSEGQDKDMFLSNGRFFLHNTNAGGFYYGRYLTETNDAMVDALLNPKSSNKRKKKNTAVDLFELYNQS